MSEFKVGDYVVITEDYYMCDSGLIGRIFPVLKVIDASMVHLPEPARGWHISKLELAPKEIVESPLFKIMQEDF